MFSPFPFNLEKHICFQAQKKLINFRPKKRKAAQNGGTAAALWLFFPSLPEKSHCLKLFQNIIPSVYKKPPSLYA